jgi:phospholipid/cholesterol/gamma-HCH transport system substrate-binding protein
MPTPTPPNGPVLDPLPPVKNLEVKAALLLLLLLILVVGSALYVMYARGVFESTQQLVLVADDSEGVIVGMDLTFAGFPIGKVAQLGWPRTATCASWWTCRPRTRSGCAAPASSPWKRR